MDKRGEGVPIILERSTALSGKAPVYRLVDESEIPWDLLAFPSTEYALRRFVEDRASGVDRHHVAEMQRRF
jgi:hypothetical protein